MLQLCPAIPAKFPPFQIKKKMLDILPAGSLSDYLTALGLSWQSVKEGWGRRGDKRGGKRVELTRDEVLLRTCVCMCVSVYFVHVCECSKSINVRKFSKSIPELILECQICFPSCCPSFKWECYNSQSDYMDLSLICWIPHCQHPNSPIPKHPFIPAQIIHISWRTIPQIISSWTAQRE